MHGTFSPQALSWLGDILRTPNQMFEFKKMKGATSSSVFLLEPKASSSFPQRFVLRILNNPEWLEEEPDLALHEAAALQEAAKTGLPVPKLISYNPEDIGFGGPVVLMSYLEGNVDLQSSPHFAWQENLAGTLAKIHQHKAPEFPWQFKSWVKREILEVPSWTSDPETWEKAIEIYLNKKPNLGNPVFIHRDYHTTNVLWKNGTICGVVDWINACIGPAGVDLGHCRTNLALMYGPESAEEFLQAYLNVAHQFNYDAYWDFETIFDMCFPEPPFYHPWLEFGLQQIPPSVLQERIDVYLEAVVNKELYT